tara:strand:+ start:9 stop:518 length:510 start_codon:yes stop_codon:yes gene_type:complete
MNKMKTLYSENSSLHNSVEDIHRHLMQEYRMQICKVEMAIYQARQTRSNSNIQRYFNSTILRNGFSRWMVYGAYVNQFYTITELVNEMHSNRQSISTMINECEPQGWVTVKKIGSTVSCQASQPLIDAMEIYCEWRKELVKSSIGKAYESLEYFEKLMQKEFTSLEQNM